jgi:hypothetical protein
MTTPAYYYISEALSAEQALSQKGKEIRLDLVRAPFRSAGVSFVSFLPLTGVRRI